MACFAGPAAIILVLALVTPGVRRPGQKRLYSSIRDKIWDANAGWLGLAAALAVTLFVTSGLKAIVGKPRPNFLAICNADVDHLGDFVVGGSGSLIESDAPALVTYKICRQTDLSLLNDAFFAFPSGHSSLSWAGLLYLSLWLSMKFAVVVPYLGYYAPVANRSASDVDIVSYYHEKKAAPPLWMVVIVLVPIGAALFICASRYADFHHAGIDIFAGSVIGAIAGYSSFRLYHLPIRRGIGMAWGPREDQHAFTGNLPWHSQLASRERWVARDIEQGDVASPVRPETATSAEDMMGYEAGGNPAQFPLRPYPPQSASKGRAL